MSMKGRRTTVMLRVSALTALVVASTFGAVAFFAAPVEGAEKTHPTVNELTSEPTLSGRTEEMTQHEEAQGPAQPEGTTRTQSAAYDNECLLVLTDGKYPSPDDLHNNNTLRLPAQLCLVFTKTISDLVRSGVLDIEDLTFKKYH